MVAVKLSSASKVCAWPSCWVFLVSVSRKSTRAPKMCVKGTLAPTPKWTGRIAVVGHRTTDCAQASDAHHEEGRDVGQRRLQYAVDAPGVNCRAGFGVLDLAGSGHRLGFHTQERERIVTEARAELPADGVLALRDRPRSAGCDRCSGRWHHRTRPIRTGCPPAESPSRRARMPVRR